jgi:hypothetical protein
MSIRLWLRANESTPQVGRSSEVDRALHHRHAAPADTGCDDLAGLLLGRGVEDAAQYLKSAELVLWLCNRLGFAPDRNHISGHSEADPSATHSNCPQRVLKWDLYMSAISDQQEIARGGTSMRLWNDDEI